MEEKNAGYKGEKPEEFDVQIKKLNGNKSSQENRWTGHLLLAKEASNVWGKSGKACNVELKTHLEGITVPAEETEEGVNRS